uniref:Uncharacterized protein n=1 Tax=Glossina morsitans morsitans TaxID=37546 RepID=A0A1B0FNI6_GLOMM
MPIKQCAKIENTQIRLLINDEDLLNEKLSDHEAASSTTTLKEKHEDHYNLYRSELKRLSYETIYRILRDENEPMYRPEDVEMRYYQKRSPSSSSSSSPSLPSDCHHPHSHHQHHHHYDDEENHDLQKRSLKETSFLNLTKMNLKKFPPYPHVLRDYETLLSLDLSENYLETVDMEEFSRLQFLNLSHNRLTYLPLWRNSSLISLNLNYNRLKSFSLAYNVKLRELYLCCNEIESLASANFTILYNLEVLDLSGNRLESLDSSLFPQMMHSLRVLNLADNQFVTVYRETFYNLLSLNTLLLAGNNISDIDYETFLALPNLQYLDLSYNQLQGKSIRALQGITGLVALSIAFNPHLGPYMQEFVASWSLKELDASGTGLCQIPAALALS